MKYRETPIYRRFREHGCRVESGRARGRRMRGSSIYVAFWRGVDGAGIDSAGRHVAKGATRPPYVPGSLAAIAWYAGRDRRVAGLETAGIENDPAHANDRPGRPG